MADRINGKFAPGHKGFKPKGSNKYGKFKAMARSKEPELLKKLFTMAMDGNPTALNFVLVKLYGSSPLPDRIALDGDTTSEQIGNLNSLIKSGKARCRHKMFHHYWTWLSSGKRRLRLMN